MSAIARPALILPRVKPRAERRTPHLLSVVAICWLLGEVCITSPAHSALSLGGIDLIVAAKGAARVLAFLVFSHMILRTHMQQRATAVLLRCTPLIVFGLWTLATCLWSPIKTISIGHATETVMLVLLAIAIGIVYRGERDLEYLLRNIVLMISGLMLVMILLNWDLIRAGQRPANYIQPNNLAGIASVGLLVLLLSRFFWNWSWTRKLLWPCGLICGSILLVAQSRSCLIVTALIAVPLLWSMQKRKIVVFAAAAVGIIAAVLPYSQTVSKLPAAVSSYVMRGQGVADAYTVSGRTEVWNIGIKSFLESPLFGHGYYSMTSTGKMYVWGAERWQTAHNIYLHVLTGTGVIGFFLLMWALFNVLRPMIAYARRRGPQRRVAIFVLLLTAWYLALGCFELSFAGPVDPEVVLFFMILGISAGFIANERERHARTSST
jgi:O-antigen ligase